MGTGGIWMEEEGEEEEAEEDLLWMEAVLVEAMGDEEGEAVVPQEEEETVIRVPIIALMEEVLMRGEDPQTDCLPEEDLRLEEDVWEVEEEELAWNMIAVGQMLLAEELVPVELVLLVDEVIQGGDMMTLAVEGVVLIEEVVLTEAGA